MISISEIKKFFKGRITLNENLAKYTTYRIGGDADVYLEPSDEEDLLKITEYLNENYISFYLLGNGSNILISDEGIRGVVMNLESGFSYLRKEGNKVISGAGVKMAKFVDFCIQNGFAGVEMLSGIPATIGGALVMNAGCYGGETGTYIDSVRTVWNGKKKILSKDECGFVYRNSKLKNTIVYEAAFKLPKGNTDELSALRKEFLLHRNQTQPVDIPNAGCVFKNPHGNYAAKLIDECGLKGTKVGGAMVSIKHANFIVNFDNASSSDVIELIKVVRKKVFEKTGIKLELEIKPVGFVEVIV